MFKKIMVPLDGSERAECVIPYVEAFIDRWQVETIILVRVIRPTPITAFLAATEEGNQALTEELLSKTKEVEEERIASAAGYLSEIKGRLKQNGARLLTEVLVGKVAASLMEFSEANDIDLILIATHGRSGVSQWRWVRGSIADRILRASRIPVLMIRAPGTISEGKE